MAVDYSQAEQDRERIIRERQRATIRSFERMKARIDRQISEMNMSTVSERARRQQLEEIRNELEKTLGRYYSGLEDGLKADMLSVGASVLSDSEAFYKSLNMPISMAISSFPVEIMENIINGTVYNEQWFLSGALWGDYQSKLGDINQIVAEGIGMNLSSLEIAKQLEQFVDPAAMKPSAAIVTPCLQDPNTGKLYSMDYVKRHPEKDWSGFKEKTSRYYYGKVDYNAQRLARTLVAHAYQQNVVRQAQANPFASGVKWEASGGERMCEICEERDGKVFPVDDVPLDHPNGMCTFTVETPSMMEMSDILADWVNGEPTGWDDRLNAYYEGRPIDHKAPLSQARKTVDKNDKEFKKYFSNLRTKTGEGGYGHIMDLIAAEYGEVNAKTKLEFYNKYIIGGLAMPSRGEITFIKLRNEVKFNECKDLLFKETSLKAMSVLSGGDMTGGSCASLALSYIGRRIGIDVVDYRGGKSREWFSNKLNKKSLADFVGASVQSFRNERRENGFSVLKKAGLEPGKEYLVGYARHMAVVRMDNNGRFSYLELQSPREGGNGWKLLTEESMEWRFGAGTTSGEGVDVYDFSGADYERFKEILGYINTSESEQQKGSGGNIK